MHIWLLADQITMYDNLADILVTTLRVTAAI